MALIENHTPRTDMKKANGPSIVIQEQMFFETDNIEVLYWAEHYELQVTLSSEKRKLKIRLGHDDLISIVKLFNECQEINQPMICPDCQEICCDCENK